MNETSPFAFSLTALSLLFGGVLLCVRFVSKVKPEDRRFAQSCLLGAFWVLALVGFWSRAIVLQGRFPYGDGEGYHQAAIDSVEVFKQGKYKIDSHNMLRLNYSGYPAYFMGPIYAAGGPHPVLVVIAQMILHLHIAMMIYWIAHCIDDQTSSARYAFFFALFFPDSIAFSLYILKDELLLWAVVLSLLNSIRIYRYGFSGQRLLGVAFSAWTLSMLRMPVCLMSLCAFAVACMDRQFLSTLGTAVAKVAGLSIVAWIFWDRFSFSYWEIESFMKADYYRQGGVFSAAETPAQTLSVIQGAPAYAFIHAVKIVQAAFTGGATAVREIGDMAFQVSQLNIASPIISTGALWRYLNLPWTLYGLWIILTRYRRRAGAVLVFTFALLAVLFVLGYTGRWGLPGMILNCLAWGFGYARSGVRAASFAGPQRQALAAG